MIDLFAFDAVLLVSVREGRRGAPREGGLVSCTVIKKAGTEAGDREGLGGRVGEGDILEGEG
jgi:hypothetical protein